MQQRTPTAIPTYNFGSNDFTIESVQYRGHTFYDSGKTLGQGHSCTAKLFKSNSQPVVIKSIFPPSESVDDYYLVREKDMHLTSLIYPSVTGYYLSEYESKRPLENMNTSGTLGLAQESSYEVIHAFFVFMPFFPGVTLDKAIGDQRITGKEKLKILLAVAKELQRIHALDILHGDIKADNILVDTKSKWITGEVIIHFIDFEWGYKITNRYAPKTKAKHKDAFHFAPERTGDNDKDIAPHVSQDIYSFGHLLNYLSCNNLFLTNITKDYSDRCLKEKHAERPGLNEFIDLIDASLKKINSSEQDRLKINPFVNEKGGSLMFSAVVNRSPEPLSLGDPAARVFTPLR